jgi:hypothetical protein
VEEIAKYLAGEWAVISGAPVAFFAATLVAALVIWRAMEWAYRHRLDGAQEESERLTRELGDYRNKLAGATPDEAKERIEALERQITELLPRRLTSAQMDSLRENLHAGVPQAPTAYFVEIAHDMGCTDAQSFKGQLMNAFQSAGGWAISGPAVLGIGTLPPTGLGIHAIDPSRPQGGEKIIADAFTKAGIPFDMLPGGHPGAIRLLISIRQ